MECLDTQASQDHLGLSRGFHKTFASSISRATNANAIVSRIVEGIMKDDQYVSSSVKLSIGLL